MMQDPNIPDVRPDDSTVAVPSLVVDESRTNVVDISPRLALHEVDGASKVLSTGQKIFAIFLLGLLVGIRRPPGHIADLAAFHAEPFQEGLDLGRTAFDAGSLLDGLLRLRNRARRMVLEIGFQGGSVGIQFASRALIPVFFSCSIPPA